MGQDTRIENSKGRVGSTNPNHPGSLGSKLKTKKILILMLNSFLERKFHMSYTIIKITNLVFNAGVYLFPEIRPP